MVCGHATTSATMHATTAPPDRAGALTEVAATTHVIVDGIRDVANIGRITVVIMEVTPVTGLAVEILPLVVGSDLMIQIGLLNQMILAEKNPTRIIWNMSTGKTGTHQIHAGVGMRSSRTKMNTNIVA